MKKRRLGNSALEVSAIGFSCMGLNVSHGPDLGRQDVISLLRSAAERAVTFFHTVGVYGPFAKERVGEALVRFRGQVEVASHKSDPLS